MKKITLLLFVLIFAACKNEPSVIKKVLQGNAFGTTYTIQYFTGSNFDAQKEIDSVLYSVNKSMSTYMYQSDISKINRGDSTIVVDALFKEVWRISEIVYINSQGYFDPTVGSLRNAYGFGDTPYLDVIDNKVLDSVRTLVGFRKVAIQEDGTLHKEYPNIYIDFNAVAKGYGIDCLGNMLIRNNVTDFIIELGGEVLAKGKNVLKNKPWTSGVEAIGSDIEDRRAVVYFTLQDKGLAGSGNYRKYRVDDTTGKKYVHTINPLTGLAEQNNVTSATVLAPTCALADAYATACMAMGFEKAKAMLETLKDVDAYLTYVDANKASRTYITKGFENLILK
ncbi:MAG: thiamine biosynthesis lipoprotein [Flavobacteriales bacterium]|jgi:thiamine biosynthesis lipoprotein